MDTWRLVWQATFVLGSLLFAIMSVWVTVVGWSDVKDLFVALAASAVPPKAGLAASAVPRPAAGRGRRGARSRKSR